MRRATWRSRSPTPLVCFGASDSPPSASLLVAAPAVTVLVALREEPAALAGAASLSGLPDGLSKGKEGERVEQSPRSSVMLTARRP